MKSLMPAALATLLAACATPPETKPIATVGLPNPASVSCTEKGGRVDLRPDAKGNVSGICVFADGRACEEWALYRDHRCVAPDAIKP
jgi:uncharacterized protein